MTQRGFMFSSLPACLTSRCRKASTCVLVGGDDAPPPHPHHHHHHLGHQRAPLVPLSPYHACRQGRKRETLLFTKDLFYGQSIHSCYTNTGRIGILLFWQEYKILKDNINKNTGVGTFSQVLQLDCRIKLGNLSFKCHTVIYR